MVPSVMVASDHDTDKSIITSANDILRCFRCFLQGHCERGTKKNKAGYTANTSCGRVGRGGNARFHTFRLVLTDGRTDKSSYRVACPQLKTLTKKIDGLQLEKALIENENTQERRS